MLLGYALAPVALSALVLATPTPRYFYSALPLLYLLAVDAVLALLERAPETWRPSDER